MMAGASQYHEIVGNLSYKWLGTFSLIVNVIALGGLATAQIIASSSNMHRWAPQLNKRCVCQLTG
jgi:hypothetical protein